MSLFNKEEESKHGPIHAFMMEGLVAEAEVIAKANVQIDEVTGDKNAFNNADLDRIRELNRIGLRIQLSVSDVMRAIVPAGMGEITNAIATQIGQAALSALLALKLKEGDRDSASFIVALMETLKTERGYAEMMQGFIVVLGRPQHMTKPMTAMLEAEAKAAMGGGDQPDNLIDLSTFFPTKPGEASEGPAA